MEGDDDVQQLLSELSRVSGSVSSSTPGPRGTSVTSMSDVLSPNTTRRLYEVTANMSGRKNANRTPLGTPLKTMDADLGKINPAMVVDDAALDQALAEDPCVVCYEHRVVLRSMRGSCIAIAVQEKRQEKDLTKLKDKETNKVGKFHAFVDGNPTESACEFVVIGTASKLQGVVKHGDVVALMSRANGRYLGVFDRSEEMDGEDPAMDEEELELDDLGLNEEEEDSLGVEQDWRVAARRKIAGRREYWTIVEVENETAERARERGIRVAASTARMEARARQLGYHVQPKQLAPHRREVPVAVRSSDSILLRSLHAEGLYLCLSQQKLRLSRTPNKCEWDIVKKPAPYLATWARERKVLNGTIVDSSSRTSDQSSNENLANSLNLQNRGELEQTLVDGLLYAMQGVSGDVIRFDAKLNKWFVQDIFDKALLSISERMLPLCSYFVETNQFILKRSRAEYGRVSHALASAMRSLLQEYQVLLAQLEHEKMASHLSLQKLWFYIQPSMRTMEVLATLVRKAENVTGGALLNMIHRMQSRGGDGKVRAVYNFLVQNATIPYLEMLELWIYHGVIRDPYNEFMIRVDEDTTKKTLREDFNARYWDQRYTLRKSHNPETDHVPYFLSRIAQKILTTGKYLNVVRECGRWVQNDCVQTIPYSDESHAYDQIVSRAHDFASRTLLALLLEEERLVARMRSLKHYFLLDQGDFFVHFMDIAHEELQQPVDQITVSRLQSLLEMCLRGRNVNDPFQENLVCDLVNYTLIQHVEEIHEFAGGEISTFSEPANGLLGVDAFTLDFKVGWPSSLILSRQALTKYQLIFRHLFFCKHVERKLCSTWLAHQATKELNLRSVLGPDYCLRQRMLHFLQNFEYYVMFEVLEPRWHEFEQRLATVKTVDELMKHHSEFLDTCLRECLLTHQGLLKTLAKLMTTCLLFAEQIGRFADQLKVNQGSVEAMIQDQTAVALAKEKEKASSKRKEQIARKMRIKVQENHIRSLVTQQSYRDMIRRSQTTFDEMLSTFMDELLKEATHGEYHSHLTNLCTRLDFNSYYHKK